MRGGRYIGSMLLVLLSITTTAYSQSDEIAPTTLISPDAPSLRFESIGLVDGMAQASANTIMQDSKGFLWIATQGGLHRYDGHEFKVYSATPFDTTSLSDNWVWGMAESKNGDIWATTEATGLNRLDQAPVNLRSIFTILMIPLHYPVTVLFYLSKIAAEIYG